MNKKKYNRVLSIAGSDSGGGAGLQADLKTVSSLGCYCSTVVTAITAQNTHTVTEVFILPPKLIHNQIEAVLNDIGADAIKIGMLGNAETIKTVVNSLTKYPPIPIILDPVMVAKSGATLLQADAQLALKTLLLPLVYLMTPNLLEAETLLGKSITEDRASIENACRQLKSFGSEAVLIKGGHRTGELSEDCLYFEDEIYWFSADRIQTQNTHGTGCSLSAAIAAYLAQGQSLPSSVDNAKKYVSEALKAGGSYHLGQGHGPIHHFYHWWG